MADHESVKTLEICRVPPSSPSPSAPNSLPLAYFDLSTLRFPPTSRLYFYQHPLTSLSFSDAVVSKLKHSLSLILAHYLPLAGNIVWPQDSHKPILKFVEGDAVLFIVAESDLDFHHISGAGFRQATEYSALVPHFPASEERAAAMALQVTLFPNAGFCIGISTHHAVADGNTSTSFVKSWARLCNMNVTDPMPFYDRTMVENYTAHLEPIRLNALLNAGGPNNRTLNLHAFPTQPDLLIRCTLEITHQNLQKLKQWVLTLNSQRHRLHVSSFTVALAYLLLCTAKSEGLRDGKMHCMFPMDLRSRLEPPLPANYFGNCLTGCRICVERGELLGESGIVVAAEAISKGIKSLEEEGALKAMEKQITHIINLANKDNSAEPVYYITGSPKFELYNVDFGWGRPRKVDIVTMKTTLFSLTDSRNGEGGIQIGLVGRRIELENFAALFAEGLQAL